MKLGFLIGLSTSSGLKEIWCIIFLWENNTKSIQFGKDFYMGKSLVLAEKPSVGREIARVLGCKKNDSWFENERYVVTWALGHLVTLADPELYNKKYATWNLEDLPMLPNETKIVVINQTRKQYDVVKRLLQRKDVTSVIIATDAGREGELVARWILEKANIRKPVKRLWISSVTDKAIKEGFGKLKDGKAYENLFAAAVARAEVDWIVGLNATRALTCKYNAQLSCGRVQTPTLAMLAQREDEIKHFSPKSYYGLQARSGKLILTWQDAKSKGSRSFDEKRIDSLIAALAGKSLTIKSIVKKVKKTSSPALYNLTELQKDADRIYDFTAKETLSIMQSLYETHKLLTYPRTDSRYLTADIVPTIKERLNGCADGSFADIASDLMRNPIKPSKLFVDDSKVTDHHAIIPTEETLRVNDLSSREYKIYDLVVRRFLSVLSEPHEYEQITLQAEAEGEIFSANGKRVIHQGWKAVSENHEENDEPEEYTNQMFPNLKKGDALPIDRWAKTKGKTSPPPRFTEGTLLGAMENPAKYVSSNEKDLAKILTDTGGIGTVATRADIIEKIQKSFLVEKRGKNLLITSKGLQLLDLVPEDLKTPALTARWEKKLESIAKGNLDKKAFMNEMKKYTEKIIQDIKNSEATFKHDNVTHEKCPDCGKNLLQVKGKRGTMLVCPDRDCGYRKGLSIVTNARCPVCHKKLKLVGEGEGKTFVCTCGHREKMSSFNKRKEGEKGKASYNDVKDYMNKNKKEEPKVEDSPFAALAKLKFDKNK